MSELNLVGLHEDGESLVLAGPAGERYTVRIDDAIRAAVRRDRPQLEQLRASSTGTLPVREIQARIRAGASAEQVAADAGVPVEHVRRYEGPVLAEREHVVGRARAARLGGSGAPTLEDLVADRLASRDVEPDGVAWDASRDPSGTWQAVVRFTAGGTARVATWAYDAQARTVHALDDEARWLSETEVPGARGGAADGRGEGGGADGDVESALRPVLSAVDGLLDRGRDPRRSKDAATTDALLDDLGRRRGTRTPDVVEDDFEGFGPLRDAPHPAGSREDRHPSRLGERASAHDDAPADPHDDLSAGTHSASSDRAGGADGRRTRHERVPVTDRVSVADVVALPFPAHDAYDDRDEHDDRVRDDAHDHARAGVPRPGDPASSGAGVASRERGDSAPPDGDNRLDPADGDRPPEPARRTSARKQRAKMPSWDEIMFGSRTDA